MLFTYCGNPLKIFEKPITFEFVCFFPYFFRIMIINFSNVLEIAWISALPEIYI